MEHDYKKNQLILTEYFSYALIPQVDNSTLINTDDNDLFSIRI